MVGKRSDPVPKSGSSKNSATQHQLTVASGRAAFRILCLENQVRAVTKNSAQGLVNSKESKIRVEKAPIDSPDRVVLIIARVCSTSRVKLAEEEEEIEVSKAQEALIRVFENLIESGAPKVSCRLLVEGRYVDALLFEYWDCEVEMRRDNLPICADRDDVMVQIRGNVVAVKKALVSISRWLQVYQSTNKLRLIGGTPLPDFKPLIALKDDKQDLVFKILCPTKIADGVIGPLGNTIKIMRSQTGVFIDVVNLDGCDDCLIAVIGSEDPTNPNSSTQSAFLLVFSKLYETSTEGSITARLVVSESQMGSLMGTGGRIVSEMRKSSGANINILYREENPKCISKDDQVVEIKGKVANVQKAISDVTCKLRDKLFHYSWRNSATKSKDTYTPGRICHEETTNPGSTGFHPSSSPSLTMSSSLPRRSEDSSYAPTFGRQSTMGLPSSLHRRPEDSSYTNPGSMGFHPSLSPSLTMSSSLPRRSEDSSYAPTFGRQSTMGLPSSLHRRPEDSSYTNPGSTGFHPSSSPSLTMSSSLPRRSEDSYYAPNFGRQSTMGLPSSLHRRPEDSSYTNPGSMGFHPSSSPSLTMSSSLPRRSEDSSYAPTFGRQSTMDVKDISHHSSVRGSPIQPPAAPRVEYDGTGGLSSAVADLRLGSEHRYSIVEVSERIVNFLFGKHPSGQTNLQMVIKASGATVTVNDRHPGISGRSIAISGTADQLKLAEFLLTGKQRIDRKTQP